MKYLNVSQILRCKSNIEMSDIDMQATLAQMITCRQQESESYTFGDLIGAVGGYLGLFVGWSCYGWMESCVAYIDSVASRMSKIKIFS